MKTYPLLILGLFATGCAIAAGEEDADKLSTADRLDAILNVVKPGDGESLWRTMNL